MQEDELQVLGVIAGSRKALSSYEICKHLKTLTFRQVRNCLNELCKQGLVISESQEFVIGPCSRDQTARYKLVEPTNH